MHHRRLAAGVLCPVPAPLCSRRQPWNPSRRRARPGLRSPSPESPFGFQVEEEQHNWLPQQQITVWGKGTSLHFVLIFLAPPRRQPARAMNSHDRRPGPSPSLGSSVAQAGRAVKQGFELGTGTALQIARLSWFSRPCRSGPSGKKSGRPGTRGWQNEMKGRQCYLYGNLLVKFQSSWILMLIQCFIFRKIMLYWIFAWHKLLRYNSVVILDACKVMSCLLEIFSISAIYLSSLWY